MLTKSKQLFFKICNFVDFCMLCCRIEHGLLFRCIAINHSGCDSLRDQNALHLDFIQCSILQQITQNQNIFPKLNMKGLLTLWMLCQKQYLLLNINNILFNPYLILLYIFCWWWRLISNQEPWHTRDLQKIFSRCVPDCISLTFHFITKQLFTSDL